MIKLKSFILFALSMIMALHSYSQVTVPVTIPQSELDKLKGQDGEDGVDGKTPVVKVGNTTTLTAGSPASVISTQTSDGELILNFGIPQGAKGDKGDKGDPGSGGSTARPSSTVDIYTAADIDSAISGLKAGKVSCLNFKQTDITKNITLPYKWAGSSKKVIISLNGNNLNGWIKTEMPPSYAEAENFGTQHRVEITPGTITGNGNDTGIVLYCYINAEVRGVSFKNNAVAMYTGFTMNARVIGCDATGMKKAGFVADRLRIPNPTDQAKSLQCNNIKYSSVRVHNAEGALYSFYSYANNKVIYEDCIAEGKNPNHDFYFDDGGDPVVKQVYFIRSHCENSPTKSVFFVRMNDGDVIFDGTWNQKSSPILYDVVSDAGCYVEVNNNPNILTSDKFRTSSGAFWSFYNNKRFDFATSWIGAPPVQYDLKYKYQNGSRWENSNGQLNNKKILTQ
jgi:hypothetical protein